MTVALARSGARSSPAKPRMRNTAIAKITKRHTLAANESIVARRASARRDSERCSAGPAMWERKPRTAFAPKWATRTAARTRRTISSGRSTRLTTVWALEWLSPAFTRTW